MPELFNMHIVSASNKTLEPNFQQETKICFSCFLFGLEWNLHQSINPQRIGVNNRAPRTCGHLASESPGEEAKNKSKSNGRGRTNKTHLDHKLHSPNTPFLHLQGDIWPKLHMSVQLLEDKKKPNVIYFVSATSYSTFTNPNLPLFSSNRLPLVEKLIK